MASSWMTRLAIRVAVVVGVSASVLGGAWLVTSRRPAEPPKDQIPEANFALPSTTGLAKPVEVAPPESRESQVAVSETRSDDKPKPNERKHGWKKSIHRKGRSDSHRREEGKNRRSDFEVREREPEGRTWNKRTERGND